MKRKQGFRYPAFFVFGRGGRGKGEGEPSHRPYTPTLEQSLHPDSQSRPYTPTPRLPKEGARMQADARGMQGGASRCKGMQGDASDKARRQGAGARGKQRGQGKKPKGAKR